MKRIRRREFIKYSLGLAGLALVGRYARPSLAFTGREESTKLAPERAAARAVDGPGTVIDKGKKFAMVIDVGACIGCRTCAWACKEENNIPDTISPLWIEVFELDSRVDLTGHPSPQDLKEGATTSYTESPRKGKWYLPVK